MYRSPREVRLEMPVKPYGLIGAINRLAAATGSMDYARHAEDADYNGHHIQMSFKPSAVSGPVWTAHYTWAGIRYVGRARGIDGFEACLKQALDEYNREGGGAHLDVILYGEPAEQAEQLRIALEHGLEPAALRDEDRDAEFKAWPEANAIALWRSLRRGSDFGVDHDRKLEVALIEKLQAGFEFPAEGSCEFMRIERGWRELEKIEQLGAREFRALREQRAAEKGGQS